MSFRFMFLIKSYHLLSTVTLMCYCFIIKSECLNYSLLFAIINYFSKVAKNGITALGHCYDDFLKKVLFRKKMLFGINLLLLHFLLQKC
jgi:hypothetical protein